MPLIRDALERGQRVRMTATGSSMLPFIRDGDAVELEPARSRITLGDVVLARRTPEGYVLHRVVHIEGDGFFLCGDSQQDREGPFMRRDVVGRVTTVYRGIYTLSLGHGLWRAAGRVWARCSPIGSPLLQLAYRIRRISKRFLVALLLSPPHV